MCEKCDAIRAAAEAQGDDGIEALTRAAQAGVAQAMSVSAKLMTLHGVNTADGSTEELRAVSEEDFMAVVNNLQKVGTLALELLDELHKVNDLFALQADVTGDLAVLIHEDAPALVPKANTIRDKLQEGGAEIREWHNDVIARRREAMAKDTAENEERAAERKAAASSGTPTRKELESIAEKLLADMPPEIKDMLKGMVREAKSKIVPGNDTKH